MPLLPPPDIGAAYVDDAKRPSKDFYNWIRSVYEYARGLTGGGSGSTITVSSGTGDPLQPVDLQLESGNTENAFARNIFTAFLPGPHAGAKNINLHLETRPAGSGGVNPTLDASLTTSTVKQNWLATSATGEIDSAYIHTSQGGADGGGSDCSGILISTVHIGSCGTASMWEGQTRHVDRGSSTVDLSYNCIAGLNIPVGLGAEAYGFNVAPTLGFVNYGYYVGPNNGNVPLVYFPFYYYGGSQARIFGVDIDANVETTGSFGYNNVAGGSGVGGVVTQATNKSTSVTLNKICGQIITSNSAMTSSTTATFQVLDALVSATDTIVLNIKSGGTAGNYSAVVSTVSNGSFWVTIIAFVSASDALTLNFAILKAVNS